MDARRGLGWIVALVCAIFAVLAPAASAYPPIFAWGDQSPIDTIRPPWVTYQIASGACPSTQLCVVADAQGNVYVSEDPAGGSDTWRIAEADWRHPIWDMACPSTSLCVGVDDAGNVVTSHDPKGGTWSVKHVSERPLRHLECPTTSFCIASDDQTGSIFTSSDAATWTKTPIGFVLDSLACPTASLCVAGTFASGIVVSTDPGGGAATWHGTAYLDGFQPSGVGVSCASAALCVASDGSGRYAVSTNPSGGQDAWSLHMFARNAGVVCPASSLCFATEYEGDLLTSTDAGAATWTPKAVPDDFGTPLACAGTALCIATRADWRGALYVSESPASGPWTPAAGFDGMGTNALLATDCPSATRCFATDDAGRVLSTSQPTSLDRHAWTPLDIGAGALGALSCPTTTLCVAGDDDGNVYRSSDGWNRVRVASAAITGVDCPTASFCVAVDEAGVAHTWSGGAWTSAPVSTHALTAVSCASETLCMTGDDTGRTFSLTAGAWRQTENSLVAALVDVSCPSDALCAAVDDDGHIAFNTDPSYANAHWLWETPGVNSFTSVDCPSDSLCVASTAEGVLYSSTDPANKHTTWDQEKRYETPLTDVACAGGDVCVAVDSLGELGAGAGLGFPYNTERPKVSGTALPGQVMTCSPGTWTGSPSFSYQWRRADNDIVGATGPQYTVTAADHGWPLSCSVTAKTVADRAVASSSPRAPVVPALIVTRAPQITGTTIVGYAVRCDGAAFSGSGAVNITAYAWYRDGVKIDWPAQDSHYILTSADAGHRLTCSATATNDTTSLTATSGPVVVDGRVTIPEQPRLSARISAKTVRRAALLRTGLPVKVTCSQRCVVSVVVRQGGHVAGRATTTLKAGGARTIRIRMSARVKRVKARKFSLAVSATERTAGRLLGATVSVRR